MPSTGSSRRPGRGFSSFVSKYLEECGRPPVREGDAVPIPADGSQRRFFRFGAGSKGVSVIAVENPPTTPFFRRENVAYLKIGRHLASRGVPVPRIHRWDLEKGWFVVEDLGDARLQDMTGGEGRGGPLYEQVLEALFHMQVRGARDFDTAWCCQTERYDLSLMRRYESDYFKEAFLKGYLGLPALRGKLDPAFDHLAAAAMQAGARFFLHRDCQSRNILVTGDRVAFVDWQGGRLGPLGYDLASLLIDPYARLSPSERTRLYRFYLELLRDHDPAWLGPFEETYPYLALQRNLQILGAFAFLSRVRRKPFFEAFIPPAFRSLESGLKRLSDPGLQPLSALLDSVPRPWEAL